MNEGNETVEKTCNAPKLTNHRFYPQLEQLIPIKAENILMGKRWREIKQVPYPLKSQCAARLS